MTDDRDMDDAPGPQGPGLDPHTYDDEDIPGPPLPSRGSGSRRSGAGRGAGSRAGRGGAASHAADARGRGAGRVGRAPRRRRGCVAALVFLIAVVAAGGGGVWYTFFRPVSNVPAGRRLSVTVARGASSREVGDMLAEKGIVANGTMFYFLGRSEGLGSRLKAGRYTLTTGSDYDAVFAVLEKGPAVIRYTKVAIPEGWTVKQVAARVESVVGIPRDEFTRVATTGAKTFDFEFLKADPTDSVEGYLFPKTYEVKEKSTAEDVIRLMLTQYGKETAALDLSYAASKGVSQHGVVTIASIIEREASVPRDRPLVASVIYNRLASHMRLQLDSTVLYVIGSKEKVLLTDLQTPSPYNTYLHEGLPPGPIASPGLTALQAAAAPAKSNYLYYIMDHKDGSQSFAVGYAEFLRLKAGAKSGLK